MRQGTDSGSSTRSPATSVAPSTSPLRRPGWRFLWTAASGTGARSTARNLGQNSEWWTTKLAANKARDADTDRLLQEAGWRVVRIWEHEDVPTAVAKVEAVLDEVRGPRPGPPG